MITFKNVNKSFASHQVLKNINFEINQGEAFCLLGKSGSGKTTLLKMINKLIYPDNGSVFIEGKDAKSINDISLRRNIGYIIQSGGLFPHLKIRDNIAISLKLDGKSKDQINHRVKELIVQIGLDENYLDRHPITLSGGQQQRIGIARAIANNPSMILMDEPFSALDPILREQMQNDFINMTALKNTTKVIVTHDIDEALKLGNRICLLENGEITFIGTPQEFLSSENQNVINFLGEESNILKIKHTPMSQMGDQEKLNYIPDTYEEVNDQTNIIQVFNSNNAYVKNTSNGNFYSIKSIKDHFITHLGKVL